jgi:hypothetical protein
MLPPRTTTTKRFYVGVCVIAFCLLTGCEKVFLDRQMEALCKSDGGVKVYETVTLAPTMFDNLGDPFPGWPNRSTEDRFGSDYRNLVETVLLKNGDPQKGEGRLARTSQKILRRVDGKLLGEAVTYYRSGGDFIPYAHPSSNSCPVYPNVTDTVVRAVFLKKTG